MNDYYYYQPKGNDNPDSAASVSPAPRKRHRLLKVVVFSIVVILLLGSLLAVVAYWYVKNIPLANDGGRTNILVLGVDEVAKLSDTVMLVSVDHSDKERPEVVVLGLPRDFYLPIPGFGSAKLNAAHAYGENYDYPGGGAALTAATLENSLGQNIHYFVTLDFTGFEKIIDAVGGVEVEVLRDLEDPFYPNDDYSGYEPFRIEAGSHQLDGATALRYARSRQTTSDFDRAFRQQQVMLAVQDKVLQREMLFDLGTIRSLLDMFYQHTDTNISRLELLKFVNLVRQFNGTTPKQYVLDNTNLLVPTFNEAGASLVPRAGGFTEIQEFVDDIFDQTSVQEFTHQY